MGSDVFNTHDAVLYYYGSDEPDAHDVAPGWWEKNPVDQNQPDYEKKHYEAYARGLSEGLGSNGRRLIRRGWPAILERFAPHAASYLIVNGTTRPLNWAVYGQITDVTNHDPYVINYMGADHSYVREGLTLMRQAGIPSPMHACLETFTHGGERRAPVPAEYRQNVVQAIGCGMKGLTTWYWPSSSGMTGISNIPPLKEEFVAVNRLIEHIEDDLLLGTPVDLVSNDSGLVQSGPVYFVEGPYKRDEPWMKPRVWTSSLLCGPETIVIAAANHIPASKTAPEHIEPANKVTITVQLPKYLPNVATFEVTEDGILPYPYRVAGGKAIINIDQLFSGRVFLLRKD